MARGQLQFGRREGEATPDDEVNAALAAFGLQADMEIEVDEEFALWPDCLDAFQLWQLVQTQWKTNAAGRPDGLNYPGVEVVMDRRRIAPENRDEMFALMQVMERATLVEWNSAK